MKQAQIVAITNILNRFQNDISLPNDISYAFFKIGKLIQTQVEFQIKHQNELVSFKGMKVEACNDAGDAFMYNWDGSGTQGDDLYFNVQTADGQEFTFTVESYLCDKDTDVYKAVEALQVGDVVDLEGFLYWYNGANPHITSVTVK